MTNFFLRFFYSQIFVPLPTPTTSFSGQTVIITGSNTGLGLEAARHVVRLGVAKLILAVRDVAKGESAADDIRRTTEVDRSVIEVWPLDLGDYDSVKQFLERVKGLDRLDALLQNAGLITGKFVVTPGGDEIHIAVHIVGAVLLGLGVLPKLRETGKRFEKKAILSFVGSDTHYVAQPGVLKAAGEDGSLFEVLNKEENMAGRCVYFCISYKGGNSRISLVRATRC